MLSDPVKLRYVNYILLIVIVVCNGYVLFGLIKPAVEPAIRRVIAPVNVLTGDKSIDEPNAVIIPKIQVKAVIKTENTPESMNDAVWYRPASVEPGKGGNTILAGHRFSYRTASLLYNLDQIAQGDKIQIIWSNKLYNYRVTEIKEVDPDAVEIEGQDFGERVTIYTCTPLWSTAKRLVVIGEPIHE